MFIKISALYIDKPLSEQVRNELFKLLPKERAQRLLSKFNEGFGDEVLCAYTLLRMMIKQNFSRDIDDIKYLAQGKPYFENKDIFFNLSHTRGAVVCAVGDTNMGVDIETIGRTRKSMIKRLLSDTEKQDVAEQRGFTLNEYFVLKESYMKYTGKGMSEGFENIIVQKSGSEIISNKDSYFTLYNDVENKYNIACCVGFDINIDLINLSIDNMVSWI